MEQRKIEVKRLDDPLFCNIGVLKSMKKIDLSKNKAFGHYFSLGLTKEEAIEVYNKLGLILKGGN